MATAAGRAGATRAWCLRAALAFVAFALVLASTRAALAGKPGGLPEGDIADIKIEGNSSITSEKIRGKMKSRVGRPIDQAVVEADLRALEATNWFSEVKIFYDEAPGDKRPILVIRVVEMPVLKDVQFIGLIDTWGHVRLKDIEEARS
jgi:outer membrane protein assembly factor BamA